MFKKYATSFIYVVGLATFFLGQAGYAATQVIVVTNEVTDIQNLYQPDVDIMAYDSTNNVCDTEHLGPYLDSVTIRAGSGNCSKIVDMKINLNNEPFTQVVWDVTPLDQPVSTAAIQVLVKSKSDPTFNTDGSIKTAGVGQLEAQTLY